MAGGASEQAARLDIDAYLERIKWRASTSPTLETLSGLLSAHMARIPFENIDVLLGRPIRLDLDGLQAKLVRARRGGYCFEHATLFAAVLTQLGFRPSTHSARVVLVAPREHAPRSHMFLTVAVSGTTYVVDPGFGRLAPQAPLPLVHARETRAGHETYWMLHEPPHWVMRTRAGDKVADAWVSTLEADTQVDFEVANHYVATHPRSPFVNRLMLRAIRDDGSYVAVMNRDVTTWRSGVPQASELADRRALRALLAGDFGMDLPEVESLHVPSIPEWP